MQQGDATFSGGLVANHFRNGELINTVGKDVQTAPFWWKFRNKTRRNYIFGTVANKTAKMFSKATGIPTMTAELRAKKICADGSVIDYGVLGRRVVTTAFVEFMVDQLQADTTEWGDFKFHDSGVGVVAENVADTDMGTTDGEARATGTQVEGATADIYRSVGTISYTTTKAITEHGLFSIVTGGTMMDRTVFTVINVVNGDSIQFTYELTVNDGG